MAWDRQGTALTVIRIAVGVFLVGQAAASARWLVDGSILNRQLVEWLHAAAPGSFLHSYLATVAIPGSAVFARLTPVAQFVCGASLVLGFETRIAALVAFLMALNGQFLSGALLRWGVVRAMPLLGSTLGLALGGVRLPWSFRR